MSSTLVRPLPDAWQGVLDAVLRRRGAPSLADVARLAPRLVELSRAYNLGLAGDGARVKVPLEARIAFSFARDVPKGAAAVRELVGAGALGARGDRALRIADLGAGLGAMTWGVARALASAGPAPLAVEALLVDEDAEALGAAEALAREAAARLGPSAGEVAVTTRTARIAQGMSLPESDVVVLGQVLSELDVALEPAARAERHAALLHDLLVRGVAPDGALVVVEPALRDRTRHLHAVRDLLLGLGATVFAPCLHAAACPVLAAPSDWCHDDLAVDLPAWLVPLARAAGLRWQGLTFSYLVLRRDGRRLIDALASGPRGTEPRVHLRVISELMRTKGKAELFACTDAGARVRMRRLDRDAVASGDGAAAATAWSGLGRGDLVSLRGDDACVDARGRVSPAAKIDVWSGCK